MKHHTRTYRSGTSWCVWRWTEVDSEYITRLFLVKTPWFAVCLHWLHKPDPEPWLHDHPVSFVSFILRGGYCEIRERRWRYGYYRDDIQHTWTNFVSASPFDRHRITYVRPRTLTLAFMGPKTREWGFHTDRGWIYWKDYYAEQRKAGGKS